jgi:hypothetical protein
MAELAAAGSNRIEEGGGVAADSQMTTVTTDSSAHSKGSYTQIIAATEFEATAIMVNLGVRERGRNR